MSESCAIVIMAKAPVAGYAKTRLIPALGADGAALLAHRMLVHIVDEATKCSVGSVYLSCAPDSRHPAFRSFAAIPDLTLCDQAPGDIGERMRHAFDCALSKYSCALVVGSDAPALDVSLMQRARAAINHHDAVFVPTRDGGYVLIALRRAEPTLFEGIAWGTSTVMRETRERLTRAGMRYAELEPIADIDEPESLSSLPAGWLQ